MASTASSQVLGFERSAQKDHSRLAPHLRKFRKYLVVRKKGCWQEGTSIRKLSSAIAAAAEMAEPKKAVLW
jgi:hypothetical protein